MNRLYDLIAELVVGFVFLLSRIIDSRQARNSQPRRSA